MLKDCKLQQLAIDGEIYFDLELVNDDLVLEEGLETAVIVSLFTDARVTFEELPTGETDQKGYWGDAVSEPTIGSKLWLLQREKLLDETAARAEQYASDALQWMVDEDIIESFTVDATIIEPTDGVKQRMDLDISILRGNRDPIRFKFNYLWNGQLAQSSVVNG